MYSEKLAIAVKHNNRVLREHGDAVYLPYGCEYAILVKNLNSLKALVRIWVDGQEATEGTSGLIVPPNQSVDLERFIKSGNLQEGNRFKFIERTSKIEEGPRGIQVDDGLIRVEFEFEKQAPKIETIHRTYVDEWHYRRQYPYSWTSDSFIGTSGLHGASLTSTQSISPTSAVSTSSVKTSSPLRSFSSGAEVGQNTVGITVPGSVSDQKFETGAWFATDGQKHSMVLRLLGAVGETAVSQPVTVKSKPKCSTCGHLNKSGAKFCVACGTGLSIV